IPRVGDSLALVPHDPRALGCYVMDFGSGQYQVGFSHEHDFPDEGAREPADVDAFLRPAVEGRVRMLLGRRRAVIQIGDGDEYDDLGTHYGVGAWYPIPGWRQRADVVTYAPFRQ